MALYEIDGDYAGGLHDVGGRRPRRVTLVFDDSGVVLHGRHGVLWQAVWTDVTAVDVVRDDEGNRTPGLGSLLVFGMWAWVLAPRRYETYVTVVTETERPVVRVDLLPGEVDAVFGKVRRLIPA